MRRVQLIWPTREADQQKENQLCIIFLLHVFQRKVSFVSVLKMRWDSSNVQHMLREGNLGGIWGWKGPEKPGYLRRKVNQTERGRILPRQDEEEKHEDIRRLKELSASWEVPQQSRLIAAFWISWRLFRESVGQPNNKELQSSNQTSGNQRKPEETSGNQRKLAETRGNQQKPEETSGN